jgi:hypothetical protein
VADGVKREEEDLEIDDTEVVFLGSHALVHPR